MNEMENKNEKPNGAKMVSAAIIGMDYRNVLVNGKVYAIHPPTIAKIAGAAYWLSDLGDGKTLKELIGSLTSIGNLAHCLSWFIKGNDDLAEELSQAKIGEVVEAIETAFTLIDAGNFLKLSALLRSVRPLIAKQNT